MQILVIDDNANHQKAAQEQLKEYDVTVVGTYDEAQNLLKCKHAFNVVLADLLLPISGQRKGRVNHPVDVEMPIGIFLALLAAKNGASHVAVFTDTNHHNHPASACFDAFGTPWTPFDSSVNTTSMVVNGAKLVLCNNMEWVDHTSDEPPQSIKRWDKLLNFLMHC